MGRMLTFLLALSLTSMSAGASPMRPEFVDVSTHIDYLIDASHSRSIEEIIQVPNSDWSNTEDLSVNFGFRKEVFWFRIALPQCSENKKVLELAYPLLDSIRVWFIKG